MPTREEIDYQNKIDVLRAQRDDAAKALGLTQGQIDTGKGEVSRLTDEKAKLESYINELNHDVENLQKQIDEKKAEGLKTIQDLSDQLSALKVQVDAADFTLKNLTSKIEELTKKKADLIGVEQQFIQAVARLETALQKAQDAEHENEKAALERDRLIQDARDVNEAAHVREQKVALAESALKEAQDTTEFYRNRIVAYCVEKGLPVPDFSNG